MTRKAHHCGKRAHRIGVALLAIGLSAGAAASDGFDAARPEVQAFIDKLVTEHGFEADYVTGILAGASPRQSIIDAMTRPAEKTSIRLCTVFPIFESRSAQNAWTATRPG